MNKNGKKSSFKNLSPMKKLMTILIVVFFVALAVASIFGGVFFGIAGFFHLFDVQYESLYSLFQFVLCFFMIGFMVDLVSNTIIKIIEKKMNGKYLLFIATMGIDCSFSWIAIYLADVVIDSINVSFIVEILAVMLIFFVELAFKDKGNELNQAKS